MNNLEFVCKINTTTFKNTIENYLNYYNISYVKCIIVTTLDCAENRFLKNYYDHYCKEFKIDDAINIKQFLAPYIKIFSKKDAWKILYTILKSYGIKPDIQIMNDIYENNGHNTYHEVYECYMQQLDKSQFTLLQNLKQETITNIASADKNTFYFFLLSDLIMMHKAQ